MAPKRHYDLLPTADAANASSDDDSESEEEEEVEEEAQQQQLTQSSKPQITQQKESQESEEEDSDSESDSDSDSIKNQKKPTSDFKIDSRESKKPISSKSSKALGKRKVVEIEKNDMNGDSKKIKVSNNNKNGESVLKIKSNVDDDDDDDEEAVGDIEKEEEDKKAAAAPFTRLWTDNDEIVLLQGIIDYKSNNNGADLSSNLVAFHRSVEDSLSVNFTKTQLSDKIRRLKKKFLNNARRRRAHNGVDPVFSRPHEHKSFVLSKKIWGSDIVSDQVNPNVVSKLRSSSTSKKKEDNAANVVVSKIMPSSKSVGTSNLQEEEAEEEEDCWSLYPWLCASLESEACKYLTTPKGPKDYVKEIISVLDEDKARKLEEGWKAFFVMQHQVYAKRVELISEQTPAMLDVIQKGR